MASSLGRPQDGLCARAGRSKSSGKCVSALCTGSGVRPPSAQSEASVISVQRSSSTARFAARSCPATMRSITSTPRVEPMRQGVHLPQLSMAQNSIAKRACLAMSTRVVEHDDAAMAEHALHRRQRLVVERRVEQAVREVGAQRPAHLHGADRPAGRRAAAEILDELAQGEAEGRVSNSPPRLTLPASCTGSVPRERPMP